MLSPEALYPNAQEAARALKSISRNDEIKSYIRQSKELYPLLWKAAQRFITGEHLQEAVETALPLTRKGYAISLEYIGENTTDEKECDRVTEEFLSLIQELGSRSLHETVSLDLSHIGLSLDLGLACDNLLALADHANKSGISLMIGMEESSKTNFILDMYKKTSERFSNIGITVQAQLHRSPHDLQELLRYPGKIRLVKGAYAEPADLSLSRSPELDQRYMDMAAQLLEANHPVSIATHDENLLSEIERRFGTLPPYAEYEMLYGIRPERLSELRSQGNDCKVYLPYGQEWYLYLCHRIAEHPENIFRALADMIHPPLGGASQLYR